MSRFNTYAKKVDQIARGAFEEYQKAADEYERAKTQRDKYPQRRGMVDGEYQIKSSKAELDYQRAKATLTDAKRALEDSEREVKTLRQDLARAVNDHYAADPSAIDGNVMTLLNSGILKSTDYAKLMKDAQNAGNHTMIRLIAQSADDAAAKSDKIDRDEAIALRNVSYHGKRDDAAATLEAFDALASIYDRTVRNPDIIRYWDELSKPIVDNF